MYKSSHGRVESSQSFITNITQETNLRRIIIPSPSWLSRKSHSWVYVEPRSNKNAKDEFR
jgi:hypothetical protein